MAIRIDIKTDSKDEAKGAFQILSFLNQLENLGYVISDFTSQQREKLSSALLEFIEQTGDVLSQKSIFQKFVNTLNNNNKKG